MKRAHWIPRVMFYRVLWPSIISALALAIADIADALVVGGKVGEKGLAAIGIVTPVYMLYNLLGYGISVGGCVTHGNLTAQGRDQTALCHFRSVSRSMLVWSVVFAVLGNVIMLPFLSLLGVNESRPELLALCMEYARPLVTAAPIFMLNFVLYDFVRSDNGPALASLGFSLGCGVDLALNILLVVVLSMGVRGSIIATIAAQTVSVIILSTHLFWGRGVLRLKAIIAAREDKAEIRRQIQNSLAVGFSSSIRYFFQFAFLFLANRLLLRAGDLGLIDGDLYVAVFDVVMNVSYVALALYQACADSLQPLAAAFTQEHDKNSLHYVMRLTLFWGLGLGVLLSGLLAVGAKSVSAFFGLFDPATLAISVPAIRIFCLSTPCAGIMIMLTGYYQSSGHEKWSRGITLLRSAILLLPCTLIFGFLFPASFWWLFPVWEGLSLLTVFVVLRFHTPKETDDLPVFSASMDNSDHELGKVLSALEAFCEAQEIPMKTATRIQLAVEELCLVTMEQAFTGKKDEYIQITLARETRGDYRLCIRNSAPRFNPFLMEMGRLQREDEEKLMDSMGVMLVREQSKSLYYRNYEGFNVLIVVF